MDSTGLWRSAREKKNKAAGTSKGSGRETELGEAPIAKLLVKLSLPATIAMIVNGLYNLVDTIFIGRGVGTIAIGGLALAIPAQMMIFAFGLAVGQGSASVVSRNLGAKDYDRAAKAAGNAFTLALLSGIGVLVLGQIFMEPLLDLLGATETLRDSARSYLQIVLIGAPFLAMAMVCNNLLRAEGKARESMRIMLVGAIANIVLDPLFIFVFNLGVAGAAWATIIGQMLNFIVGIGFFLRKDTSVQISRKSLLLEGSVVKETLLLGLPTFIRQSGQSIVGILLNNLIGFYGGDIYISAYGIVNRLLMFLMMPLFGTVQGFQPIAGYNYGARKFDRVKKSLGITGLFSTVYTTVLFLLIFFLPRVFAGIFTADPLLLDTSAEVMRMIFLAFPVVGIQITGGTYFLVVGKSGPSFLLNLSRQFLFLIPLILVLPQFWSLGGLLAAFPIADVLAAVVTGIWLLREIRHLGKESLQDAS